MDTEKPSQTTSPSLRLDFRAFSDLVRSNYADHASGRAKCAVTIDHVPKPILSSS